MEEIQECIICNGKQFKEYLSCKDYFLTNEDFRIVECENCGFRFTNPRPFKEELGEYYKSDEYISHSNSRKGLVNRLYQFVRNITLKRKYKLISQYCNNGNILDIGSATGEFLNIFKKKKWDVYGVEPNENARNYAKNNYNINAGDEEVITKFEQQKFDVITLWHVLEHVASINDRIQEIKRVLKKNGILVVALPNCNSLDAKIYGKYWAAYDVPRHLYHFTQDTVERLFKKNKFELIKTRAMKFDSYYVSLLSEKYKYGKQNYFKVLWNGFRSNIHAKNNNNEYSSLIYIFKYVDI